MYNRAGLLSKLLQIPANVYEPVTYRYYGNFKYHNCTSRYQQGVLMNEGKNNWTRYGKNPYIQRNTLTKEFRCITCSMPLGDNAGGAGSHCKSSHGIRIDGSSIQEQARENNSAQAVPQDQLVPLNRNIPSDEELEKKRRLIEEINNISSPSKKDESLELYEEMEKQKVLWRKYKDLENSGVPESILRSYHIKLGIENDYVEKKKEHKLKQEKKEFREFLERAVLLKMLINT